MQTPPCIGRPWVPKTVLLCLFLIFLLLAKAQPPVIPSFSPSIPQVAGGILAWGDYDGDNDPDLFMAGVDSLGQRKAYLLENNGFAFAADPSQSLVGMAFGSADWADYDGDGDLDLAVTGDQFKDTPFTQIYLNDNGTLQPSGIPLPQLLQGFLKWADLDADGDPDLVLGGLDRTEGLVAHLYENLGNGNFRERHHPLFQGLYRGDIDIEDLNQDGRPDILYGGNYDQGGSTTKALENLGGFQFREFPGVLADGLYTGLRITPGLGGQPPMFALVAQRASKISEVYAFQGGQLVSQPYNLTGVTHGDVLWLDIDADNDADLVVAGTSSAGATTIVYENTGSGFSTFQAGSNLPALRNCQMASADWNGDGYQDLVISGFGPGSTPYAYILTFDLNQQAFRP